MVVLRALRGYSSSLVAARTILEEVNLSNFKMIPWITRCIVNDILSWGIPVKVMGSEFAKYPFNLNGQN
jgi:hypothetical protein